MKGVHEGKEKVIATMMIVGVAGFLFGLFFFFLAIVFGSSLCFGLGGLLVIGGILSGALSLYIGFSHNRASGADGPTRPQEEARVQTRFAINGIGEMIFDNYDYDAEDARFYVKGQYPNGRRDEFECARPVFDQCGEGMRGLITVQGSWLSMFVPLADDDHTKAMYRNSW